MQIQDLNPARVFGYHAVFSKRLHMTLQQHRPILDINHIHPAIRGSIAEPSHDLVPQVDAAIHAHAVVVVGMRQNPVCTKACRALDASDCCSDTLISSPPSAIRYM
jgi:hypothetical protein